MNRLIITSDGSHTIYVPELDEHYHSIHGAIQESEHIFIRNGLRYCESEPVNIFEAGFGTGLNALLTSIEAAQKGRIVYYTSIEKYPLGEEYISQLNYDAIIGEKGKDLFGLIHSAQWGSFVQISNNFFLKKIKGDLVTDIVYGSYDLVYFDAFGPLKQPEMWTPGVFSKISAVTRKDGIFMTYSSRGEVKRALHSCGFRVTLLDGPPGKRQIIRAIKM
ncbi:MAG TPA: tRNA (5-methylaminomethyl-2-thiouridine)(34)-methyltransferase MnmD [Bacteroidales bacterium]|nr:tRNA (5-methylaminomethyl-2-thiouridine)(34)-methyltransferase MnmD [Bacteroidales bacterium]